MTNVINSAGWRYWNSDDERLDGVDFAEFKNTGAGAQGQRASFVKKLTKGVTVSEVLGQDYTNWVDKQYMA